MHAHLRHQARWYPKGRLVADGSGSPLYTDAYSSVIAPDHVHLALIAATLNNLDHAMIDLENAYLHALTNELAYTYLPLEFGNLGGKTLIFHKALYGMRTSGACFHATLSDVLLSLHFIPSKADPDLWFRVHDDTSRFIMVLLSSVRRHTLPTHGRKSKTFALLNYNIMTAPWLQMITLNLTILHHLNVGHIQSTASLLGPLSGLSLLAVWRSCKQWLLYPISTSFRVKVT